MKRVRVNARVRFIYHGIVVGGAIFVDKHHKFLLSCMHETA